MPAKLPFHIMAKPIGAICNIDCRYCFYLRKQSLFPDHKNATDYRMDDRTLEAFIRQYIAAQPTPIVSFAWQGGEPTLMGIDYFRKIIKYQTKHHIPGKQISNALQTNGTLLNDEWCRFLAENNFLVGLSIDGPEELHNRYRVSRNGEPTFDSVWRALLLLKKYRIQFTTLTVVHRELACHPLEVYEFLREHGSGYIQFLPLVELAGGVDHDDWRHSSTGVTGSGRVAKVNPVPGEDRRHGTTLNLPLATAQLMPLVDPRSVDPVQFGRFLCDIFDLWVRRDVGRIYVQLFDAQIPVWAGYPSPMCIFRDTCGRAAAVEHNGNIYSCDHFVSPHRFLGNLHDKPLEEMIDSAQQEKFGTDKRDLLPRYCRECEVRFACNGECPKNRIICTPDGEPGLNYLCAGYRLFFNHIRPHMQIMADLLRNHRPIADIMPIINGERGANR